MLRRRFLAGMLGLCLRARDLPLVAHDDWRESVWKDIGANVQWMIGMEGRPMLPRLSLLRDVSIPDGEPYIVSMRDNVAQRIRDLHP